jgi:hypothetical protein
MKTNLRDRAKQRFSIIKETEGFAENIVADDFDYEAFGLTAIAV